GGRRARHLSARPATAAGQDGRRGAGRAAGAAGPDPLVSAVRRRVRGVAVRPPRRPSHRRACAAVGVPRRLRAGDRARRSGDGRHPRPDGPRHSRADHHRHGRDGVARHAGVDRARHARHRDRGPHGGVAGAAPGRRRTAGHRRRARRSRRRRMADLRRAPPVRRGRRRQRHAAPAPRGTPRHDHRPADRRRRVARAPTPGAQHGAAGRVRLAPSLAQPADSAPAEQTIRRSSYKDTDNTLARFNRRISVPISVALIRTPLTANQFSVALVAVGCYSAWLFSLGHYWPGVLGGFLSLAASVLDGCDGEIARLKYQESALGCWIETFGDYSYYIAIFVGLTVGAAHRTGWEAFYWFGAIALASLCAWSGLRASLRSGITAGRPDKLHAIARDRFKAEPTWWSRIIWRLSFVATRSAMPYGIFPLSLVNLLPLVMG